MIWPRANISRWRSVTPWCRSPPLKMKPSKSQTISELGTTETTTLMRRSNCAKSLAGRFGVLKEKRPTMFWQRRWGSNDKHLRAKELRAPRRGASHRQARALEQPTSELSSTLVPCLSHCQAQLRIVGCVRALNAGGIATARGGQNGMCSAPSSIGGALGTRCRGCH